MTSAFVDGTQQDKLRRQEYHGSLERRGFGVGPIGTRGDASGNVECEETLAETGLRTDKCL